jgi:hypothetical protein
MPGLRLDHRGEQLGRDQELVRSRLAWRRAELDLAGLEPILRRSEFADPDDVEHSVLQAPAGWKLQCVLDDASRDGVPIDLGEPPRGNEAQADPDLGQLQAASALKASEAQAVVRPHAELFHLHAWGRKVRPRCVESGRTS